MSDALDQVDWAERERELKSEAVDLLLGRRKKGYKPNRARGAHARKCIDTFPGFMESPERVSGDMRFSDLKKFAREVNELSVHLRGKLETLSNFCEDYGKKFSEQFAGRPFLDLIYNAGIRYPTHGPDEMEASICSTLGHVAALCDAIVEKSPPDIGSDTTLRDVLFGRSMAGFVADAGRLFAAFAAADLADRYNRPFFAFCQVLYELRTRRFVEDEQKRLRAHVRFAAPILVELRERIAKIRAVEGQLIGPRTDDHEVGMALFIEARTHDLTQRLLAGPVHRRADRRAGVGRPEI